MADTNTNLTATTASATMHTYLLLQHNENWYKVVDIKDYPAMGGSPEKIEATTLTNETSTFVTGVQTLDAFEFLANFTQEEYAAIRSYQTAAKIFKFALAFGKPNGTTYGNLGVFTWNGQLSIWVEGGSVNGVREMKIYVSAATEVTLEPSTVTVSTSALPKYEE